jgi:predicted  nucleic acid-binding Zn-ribbon protein
VTEPESTLKTPWQIRRRLLANEAERKAQGDEISGLIRECRQNRERLQAAHERIDEIEDNSVELLILTQRMDAMEERITGLVERLEDSEDKIVKLRDWIVKKLNGENGK